MGTSTALPPIMQPAEVRQLLEAGENPRLLDVRTPAEFESVHIPGSYNVPLDQLAEHRAELATGPATPIVIVCRSGQRARQAETVLREAAMSGLHVLDGGLLAWEAAGLPVKRGRARWSIERQVRAIAGALVLLGTLGSWLVWPPLLGLAMFVGAGLFFAGLTDSCLMGLLLARLPFNRAPSCDIALAVTQLTGRPAPGRA